MDVRYERFKLVARFEEGPLGQLRAAEEGVFEKAEAVLVREPFASAHREREVVEVMRFVLNRATLCQHERVATIRLEVIASIAAKRPADDRVGVAKPPRGKLIPGGQAVPPSLVELAGRASWDGATARR